MSNRALANVIEPAYSKKPLVPSKNVLYREILAMKRDPLQSGVCYRELVCYRGVFAMKRCKDYNAFIYEYMYKGIGQ